MTNALGRPILSGMQISMGLMIFNTALRLIPLITGACVDARSGTGLSITLGFGTGVMQ